MILLSFRNIHNIYQQSQIKVKVAVERTVFLGQLICLKHFTSTSPTEPFSNPRNKLYFQTWKLRLRNCVKVTRDNK